MKKEPQNPSPCLENDGKVTAEKVFEIIKNSKTMVYQAQIVDKFVEERLKLKDCNFSTDRQTIQNSVSNILQKLLGNDRIVVAKQEGRKIYYRIYSEEDRKLGIISSLHKIATITDDDILQVAPKMWAIKFPAEPRDNSTESGSDKKTKNKKPSKARQAAKLLQDYFSDDCFSAEAIGNTVILILHGGEKKQRTHSKTLNDILLSSQNTAQ